MSGWKERQMDEVKKEWNKEVKERETGSTAERIRLPVPLIDGLQVCVQACAFLFLS